MKSLFLVLGLAVCVGLSSCAKTQKVNAPQGPQCHLPETGILNTPLKAQETDQWCWAASGQMIMSFLNHDISQCLQANNELGRDDCCEDSKPAECVQGGWPEFEKYDFTSQRLSDAFLSWDEIREQITCKSTPIAFSWHWIGNGGHMMVVRGFTTSNGVRKLFVNNPWPPVPGAGEEQIITYEEYVSGSDHTHWDDFYNIRHH